VDLQLKTTKPIIVCNKLLNGAVMWRTS